MSNIKKITVDLVKEGIEGGGAVNVVMLEKDKEMRCMPMQMFSGLQNEVSSSFEFVGEIVGGCKGIGSDIAFLMDSWVSKLSKEDYEKGDIKRPSQDPQRTEAIILIHVDLASSDVKCVTTTIIPYEKKDDKYIWGEVSETQEDFNASRLTKAFKDGYLKTKGITGF